MAIDATIITNNCQIDLFQDILEGEVFPEIVIQSSDKVKDLHIFAIEHNLPKSNLLLCILRKYINRTNESKQKQEIIGYDEKCILIQLVYYYPKLIFICRPI